MSEFLFIKFKNLNFQFMVNSKFPLPSNPFLGFILLLMIGLLNDHSLNLHFAFLIVVNSTFRNITNKDI